MTILVTGGAGYIGSHTCVELLNAGYDVAVVDNLSNSRREAIRRVEEIAGRRVAFYQADLLDKPALERVFREHPVEAVIHFAALKAVGESVEKPLEYYWNNIAGTLTLLRTMREFGVKRIVYSSSATVYAVPDPPRPLTEDSPLGPVNPYGRTKWMGELILRDLHAADPEWAIAVLRYFNPVGAHPSGRIGEDPEGIPNNLMPYITQVAVGRRERLNVFGGDYPTADGTGVRDYIHVVDLAEGHLKALDNILTNPGYHVYNLGTGRGYSVLEVVAAFERASGRKIPYAIVDRRPGDVAVCYADPSAARDGLGWAAKRGIEEMCADAWRWQRQNPEGYGAAE